MKNIYAAVTVLVAQLLIVSVVSAEESIAYTMNKDWKACSTSGIPDTKKLSKCITYPDTGQEFKSCDNPPKAIYFARHAEKRFRDITGKNNEPEYILSIVGQKMAQHLAKVFDPVAVKMVYTNDHTRTRQTACPLMNSKKIERQVICKRETKSERFVQSALCKNHKNEVIVVIGHALTVVDILVNMKVVDPVNYLEIEYGKLYKVTFKGGKGKLDEKAIPYWNCDASDCHANGGLDVNLK
jgi:broad specificity phosphatase PhoE